MWEAPVRDRGGQDRGGDALGGPPDASRPANPWPRLVAFALAVLAALALMGVCVASYATPPRRELREALTAFTPGVPRFLPVTTFGADRDGFTYGAWVTLIDGPPNDPAPRPAALLSKVPEARCHVRWEPATQAGGRTGVFVDPCSTGRYNALGGAVEGMPLRDLDAFPARIDERGQSVVVNLTQVTLGTCRAPAATVCSPPGRAEVRAVPKAALPPDFGRR